MSDKDTNSAANLLRQSAPRETITKIAKQADQIVWDNDKNAACATEILRLCAELLSSSSASAPVEAAGMREAARLKIVELLWEDQFTGTAWAGKFHLIRRDSLAEYGALADKIFDGLRSIRSLKRPADQDGWKLVPVEPTEEMYQAALQSGFEGSFDNFSADFKSACESAPTPEAK